MYGHTPLRARPDVDDIDAARRRAGELASSRPAWMSTGLAPCAGRDPPDPDPDPKRRPYLTRATFSDPDGNRWGLQDITRRLPETRAAHSSYAAPAHDLQRVVSRADVPADPSSISVPVRRSAILATRDELLELAAALTDPGNNHVRGIALAPAFYATR